MDDLERVRAELPNLVVGEEYPESHQALARIAAVVEAARLIENSRFCDAEPLMTCLSEKCPANPLCIALDALDT